MSVRLETHTRSTHVLIQLLLFDEVQSIVDRPMQLLRLGELLVCRCTGRSEVHMHISLQENNTLEAPQRTSSKACLVSPAKPAPGMAGLNSARASQSQACKTPDCTQNATAHLFIEHWARSRGPGSGAASPRGSPLVLLWAWNWHAALALLLHSARCCMRSALKSQRCPPVPGDWMSCVFQLSPICICHAMHSHVIFRNAGQALSTTGIMQDFH